MDNKAIAGILYETADLLEIDGQDSFRIRSYRNAAQAIEALPQQISELIDEPKKILEIPGIGKGMLTNMQEMFKEGKLSLHAELLKKYRPSMLDLLKVQGLGPKTIALIWRARARFAFCRAWARSTKPSCSKPLKITAASPDAFYSMPPSAKRKKLSIT